MVRRREKRKRNKSPAAYQQHHSNSCEVPFPISSKRLRSRGDDRLRVVTVPHFACARDRAFDATLRKLLSEAKKHIKATLVLVSTDPSELASAPFTSNDRSMIMGANTQLAAAARGADVDETRLYLFGKSEKEFSGAKVILLFSNYTEADDDEQEEDEKNAEGNGKFPSQRAFVQRKPHLHPAEIDVSLITIEGDFVIPAGASLEGIAGYYKVRILARGGRIALPPSAIYLAELTSETSNSAMLRDDRMVATGEHDGNREGGNVTSLLEEILGAARAMPRPMPTPLPEPLDVPKRNRRRNTENGRRSVTLDDLMCYENSLENDTIEDDEESEEDYDGNVRIKVRRDDQATSLQRHNLALAFAERSTRSTRSENDRETRIIKDFCTAAGRLREKQKNMFWGDGGHNMHDNGLEPLEVGFPKQESSGSNPCFVEIRESNSGTDSSHAREKADRRRKTSRTQEDDIVRGLAVVGNVQHQTEHTRHQSPHSSRRQCNNTISHTTIKDSHPSKSKDQSLINRPHDSPDNSFSSYATPPSGLSPYNFHYPHQQQHRLPYPYHQESLHSQLPTSSPSTVSLHSSHSTPSPMSTDILLPGLHRNPISSPPLSNCTTTSYDSTHHPIITTKIHHNKRPLRPIISATSTAHSTRDNSPPVNGQKSYRNRNTSNPSCYGGAQRSISTTPFNSLPPSVSSSPTYPPRLSPGSMAARIAKSSPVTGPGIYSTPPSNAKSLMANSALTNHTPMSLTFGSCGFANDNNAGGPVRGYSTLRSVSGHGDSACTGDSLALWVARCEKCDGEGINSAGSNPIPVAPIVVRALLGSNIRKPDITVTLDEGERQLRRSTEVLPTKHSLVLAGGWLLGNYFYTAVVGESQILIVRDQRQEEKTGDGHVHSSKSDAFGGKRAWSLTTSSPSVSENAIISSNVNSAVYSQRRYIVGGRFPNHASANDVASSPIADGTFPSPDSTTNPQSIGPASYASEPSTLNLTSVAHVSGDSMSAASILYDTPGSSGSQTCRSTTKIVTRLPITPPEREPAFQSERFSGSSSRHIRPSSLTETQTGLKTAFETSVDRSEYQKLSKVTGTGRHAIRPGDMIVFSTGDVRRVLLQDDVLDKAARIAKVDARKAAEFLVGLWKKETGFETESSHIAKAEVVLVAVVT